MADLNLCLRAKARVERLALPGMGTCRRCNRPWKAGHLGVQEHITSYGDGRGMFPLCEGCWTELGTPEARLPYYRSLWDQWNTGGFWDQWADGSWHRWPYPEPWPVVEEAVLAEDVA